MVTHHQCIGISSSQLLKLVTNKLPIKLNGTYECGMQLHVSNDWKRPSGRPRITWIKTVLDNLESHRLKLKVLA